MANIDFNFGCRFQSSSPSQVEQFADVGEKTSLDNTFAAQNGSRRTKLSLDKKVTLASNHVANLKWYCRSNGEKEVPADMKNITFAVQGPGTLKIPSLGFPIGPNDDFTCSMQVENARDMLKKVNMLAADIVKTNNAGEVLK